MRFRFPWLEFVIASVLLAGAVPAAAQEWLADRSRAEGRGIRLGDFELHPGLGTEIGYDSNIYLAEPDEEQDSAILRVSPHLYLSTLTSERLQGQRQRLSFRAGASAAFKYYFAPSEADIGVRQDARLIWAPGDVFSLELFNQFSRSIDPFTEPAGPESAGVDQLAFARDQLGVGTRLQLSTPGGLVKGGVGYRYDIDFFEEDLFRSNNSDNHIISADTSWEFLPKTALFWNGSVRLHSYDDDTADEALTERNDSTQVRSKIGLNGALTQRVGFTLAGGYTAGFYEDDNDYESVTAQVELRWRLRQTMLWALGYDREYSTAFQGNFARMDRVKTRLQAMLGRTVVLGARAELTFVDFGYDASLDVTGEGERNDIQLVTNINGEYRIVDWLALTAEFGYLENFTDFEYVFLDADGNEVVDPAEYRRFEAWFGVRAFL
jgi:hypothetical protein